MRKVLDIMDLQLCCHKVHQLTLSLFRAYFISLYLLRLFMNDLVCEVLKEV